MKKIVLSFCLFVFLPSIVYSQTYNLSGVVTGSNNEPLAGVNIYLPSLNTGTSSNNDGMFTITGLSAGTYQIRFSYIGYKEELREVVVSSSNVELSVALSEQAVESGDVVVTAGKYEQRISELPVSASVMAAEEIRQRNFTNVEDVMRYIPGINMTEDQVSIRGSSGYSRGAGTRVLLAIDGIPFYTGLSAISLVITFITPPIALDPYRELAAPFITSIFLIWCTGIISQIISPVSPV